MPGRTLSTLKTGGLRILLESLAAERPASVVDAPDADATEAWTPVV
jgi:hypothetical protein